MTETAAPGREIVHSGKFALKCLTCNFGMVHVNYAFTEGSPNVVLSLTCPVCRTVESWTMPAQRVVTRIIP